LDSEPPQQALLFGLALLPAVLAALLSAASSVLATISGARRAALRDYLPPASRAALDRYVQNETTIEARWRVWRVLGISATAVLLSSHLARSLAVELAWAAGVGAAVGAYTIPAEIARALLSSRAELLAPRLIRWLRPFEWLAAPFADPVAWLAKTLGGGASQVRFTTAGMTETEVELIVNEGELNGSLAHDQSEMIRNVLDFGTLTAGEVMVPRTRVDALNDRMPLDEVLSTVAATQHSRYPVFSDGIDNVVGILHVKELFTAVAQNRLEQTTLRDLMRGPVAFVPESQPASTVLKEMRAGRHHLAVVIDEFGGFAGVVTLEDLLEEIVGDIQDEHDLDDEAPILELGDGKILVDASLPVSDLNRRLGTQIPDDGDYVSVGGLLVDQLGHVPSVGSSHEAYGLRFLVREADERHISRVEIQPLQPSPETEPSTQRPPRAASAA
jgi:CBS domain containing-hemolysin-like protein